MGVQAVFGDNLTNRLVIVFTAIHLLYESMQRIIYIQFVLLGYELLIKAFFANEVLVVVSEVSKIVLGDDGMARWASGVSCARHKSSKGIKGLGLVTSERLQQSLTHYRQSFSLHI